MNMFLLKLASLRSTWCAVFVLAFWVQASPLAVHVSAGEVVPGNIQPDLLHVVAAQPTTKVAVIVQMTTMTDEIEAVIDGLGGQITKRLSIINGVAAELPAAQITALARTTGVRWLSLDAPVIPTVCSSCIDTGKLLNLYNKSVRVENVWNQAPYLQGQGVGVAIVDSGIQFTHPDLRNQVVARTQTNLISIGMDGFGHGSYVAGIVGGNGTASQGGFVGIAPKVNLIDVRVATLSGISLESDVVAGLQWVFENRATYNIRVVNMSLNAGAAQSYHTSALAAASEALWFSGVVVVVAAGNSGQEALYPPANDPFVITVGAADDMGTAAIQDDVVASFSAYGTTTDGFAKPDLVAPGRKMIAPLAQPIALMGVLHPTQVVNSHYIRMSGTSVSAPVVTGAVALLLQDEPNLTPDQVKFRLMQTANKNWVGYDSVKAGAGYLDIEAAVRGTTTAAANVGLAPSQFLSTDHTDLLILRLTNGTVNWSSVNWSSVNWSSTSWGGDVWETDPVTPLVGGVANTLSGVTNTLGGVTNNTLGGVTNALGGLRLLGRSELAEGGDVFQVEEGISTEQGANTIFLPLVTTDGTAP